MASAPGTNQVCYLKPNVPSPSVALQLTSGQDYAFKTTPLVLGATSNLLDTARLGSDHKAVVLNVGNCGVGILGSFAIKSDSDVELRIMLDLNSSILNAKGKIACANDTGGAGTHLQLPGMASKRAAVAFTFKKIGFCSYSRATGNFGDTDLCARAIANGRLWQMMNVW